MEKSYFERFIIKYGLGGLTEAVKLISDDTETKVSFRTIDFGVIGSVSIKPSAIEPGEYHVYETSELLSLLRILGDSIDIDPITNGSKTTGLLLKDGKAKITFALADPVAIPDVPTLKQEPEYHFEIGINSEFAKRFTGAHGALMNNESFSIQATPTSSTAKIILGYSETNVNKVELNVTGAHVTDEIDNLGFRAEHLNNILVANKDIIDTGIMRVSNLGLLHIKFEEDIPGFVSEYYLTKQFFVLP